MLYFRNTALCLLYVNQSLCFLHQQRPSCQNPQQKQTASMMMIPNDRNNDEEENTRMLESQVRRQVMSVAAGFVGASIPLPSLAGEVGAKITKAVTTSDLGISVRTSVVKGAQVMDQIDGEWEKFSDKYGLGSERSKAGSRPKPKKIPDPKPLDVSLAKQLLEISDQAFCNQSGISSSTLANQIEKVANLVKISFERSGLVVNADNALLFETRRQFNFVTYCHFKAYSDLILEQKNIEFGSFRSKFEQQIGQQITSLILPNKYNNNKRPADPNPPEDVKKELLENALSAIDELGTIFQDKGLVALVERSSVNDDQIYDWIDDTSNLEFTVAADLDATLESQMLLQEQGFRLYPSFARYAIAYILNQVSPADQKISVMDYYFDTDYNSDPDKFEVKEILLSVIMENR